MGKSSVRTVGRWGHNVETEIVMNVGVLNKQRQLFFALLVASILPFAFAMNSVLFFALAVTFIFLLMNSVCTMTEKFLIAFCASVLFSGISVFSLRPYDIIIIFALFYVMMKKRMNLKICIKIFPFIIVVICVCCINYTGDALLESIRYVISLLLLVVVLNIDGCSFDNLSSQFAIIGIANIIMALLTFLLYTNGTLTNFSLGFIESNLFLSNRETRRVGFFSDPNKFMTFSFAMLFIIEYFMKKSKKKTFLILIYIIASILSISRTAILVIAIYLGCKLLRKIEKDSKGLFYITMILGVFVLLFLFVLDGFEDLMNLAYSAMAKILNREWTASLGDTITEDNRFLIWKQALEYIIKKPILGNGWMSNTFLLPYPTHNTVLALLLDGGIIALLTFIVLFWPVIKLKRWEFTIPFVLVPSLLLDLQNYRMWFLILGLILISKKNEPKEEYI